MEQKRTGSQKGPPIVESRDKEIDATPEAAKLMLVAPGTAPKTAGVDNILTVIVYGSDKGLIAEKMEQISEERKVEGFKHDVKNMKDSTAVVLIGPEGGKEHRAKSRSLRLCLQRGVGFCRRKLAYTLLIRLAFSRHWTSE